MQRFDNQTVLVTGGSSGIGLAAAKAYAAEGARVRITGRDAQALERISLAKTLSAELLPRGVRINVVSPGPIRTPLHGKLGLDAAALQATAAAIQGQIPLGRFGTPDELASTVLHLSARESAFIVGAELIVDGGMSTL